MYLSRRMVYNLPLVKKEFYIIINLFHKSNIKIFFKKIERCIMNGTCGLISVRYEYLWSPSTGVFNTWRRWVLIWCFTPGTKLFVYMKEKNNLDKTTIIIQKKKKKTRDLHIEQLSKKKNFVPSDFVIPNEHIIQY